jgi:hypothetical protein
MTVCKAERDCYEAGKVCKISEEMHAEVMIYFEI